MKDLEFTYEGLVDFFGQDPTLDRVISLLGETEEAQDGNISSSVGPVGINVTRNGIELVDCELNHQIGSVRLLDLVSEQLVKYYLRAYLEQNKDTLDTYETIILNRLIDLF